MRNRTKSREYGLQLLYQVELRGEERQQVLVEFWTEHEAPGEIRAYAKRLVEGTLKHQDTIDQLISSHAKNWDMKRMAIVDRNILRLGVYELMHEPDVPPNVSINEAIELAKRFGDSASPKFINGILDAIHKTHTASDPVSDTKHGNPSAVSDTESAEAREST